MTRVNGRRTQRSTICPTAGSSARTRSAPMRRSNSVRASSTVNGTPRIASAGPSGRRRGSKPRRFTCSWPSGKRAATRCAQRVATLVFPTPAVPTRAAIGAPGAPPPAGTSSASSWASSASRPVKSGTSRGSWAGTTIGARAGSDRAGGRAADWAAAPAGRAGAGGVGQPIHDLGDQPGCHQPVRSRARTGSVTFDIRPKPIRPVPERESGLGPGSGLAGDGPPTNRPAGASNRYRHPSGSGAEPAVPAPPNSPSTKEQR